MGFGAFVFQQSAVLLAQVESGEENGSALPPIWFFETNCDGYEEVLITAVDVGQPVLTNRINSDSEVRQMADVAVVWMKSPS